MNIQYLLRTTWLTLVVCGTCATASAQFGGNRIQYPLGKPTVSPYLNLIGSNSGARAGINYFGLVRPQQQFYQQSEDLRQGLYTNPGQRSRQTQQQQRGIQTPRFYRLGVTGHSTAFGTFNIPATRSAGSQNNPLSGGASSPGSMSDESGFRGSAGLRRTSGHGSGYGYGSTYNQSGQF